MLGPELGKYLTSAFTLLIILEPQGALHPAKSPLPPHGREAIGAKGIRGLWSLVRRQRQISKEICGRTLRFLPTSAAVRNSSVSTLSHLQAQNVRNANIYIRFYSTVFARGFHVRHAVGWGESHSKSKALGCSRRFWHHLPRPQ